MMTFVANVPGLWIAPVRATPVLAYADPVAPMRTRVALRIGVRDLLDVRVTLRANPQVRIEHVYDY
jgi:hypothetical protein